MSWLTCCILILPELSAQVNGKHLHHFDSLLSKANSVYDADPDLSLHIAQEALDYASVHRMEVQKAIAWTILAKTEILKGDLEAAVNHLKDAVVVFEKNNKPEYLAKCYDRLATAMGKIEKGSESIVLLLKSCSIYRKIGSVDGLRSCLMNLANEYYYTKYIQNHGFP